VATNNRQSTDYLNRRGVSVSTKDINGIISSTTDGSNAYVNTIASANVILQNNKLTSPYISADNYEIARIYFKKNGISESNASVMSLIMNDIAKMQKISVQGLIEVLSTNGVMFDVQTYLMMNLLRPMSAQVAHMVPIKNRDSYRSRNIVS